MTDAARVSLGAAEVHPLCLGTNIFGWTIGEREAFAVLDAYLAAGGNFLDTADRYPEWAPGRQGGESEAIIGRWLRRRRCRDEIVLATKVGKWSRRPGLSREAVRAGVDEALRRLGTERIDLLYAHEDDESIELEEALRAFDELVREGKVGSIGASGYSPPRLAAALDLSDAARLARFVAIQPRLNLLDRAYEHDLAPLCRARGVVCVPFQGLAEGFLTGKYRPGREDPPSARAEGARAYMGARAAALLAVLDEVAAAHATSVAAVALAWVRTRPAVVSAIASARTPEQLAELLPMAGLELAAEELERLERVSSESGEGEAP